MIPEKVVEKILVLSDGWRVRQVDYLEEESNVLIRIEETAQDVVARLVLSAVRLLKS